MSRYKISELASLSGIKTHTIRVWEQRYEILTPLRTETNIRYYDDEQLKKLLNIVTLLKAGHKISAIGKLSPQQINEQISLLTTGSRGTGIKEEMLINQLVSAGLTYDEALFEKAFSNSILSFGLLEAYEKVVYPMIAKIGMLWTTSELNPSQEHFVSNLVKQKMFAAIDALTPSVNETEKWLLFLPSGELHEMGLLISNYALRSKGFKVIYLGADVPFENLEKVLIELKPTHCLTFSVKPNQEAEINRYLGLLAKDFKDVTTVLCCSESILPDLEIGPNQKTINTFQDFQNFVSA